MNLNKLAMKYIFSLLLISSLISLNSCADKPSRPDSLLSQAQIDAANNEAQAQANGAVQAAVGGGTTLPHYYCPNSCEGSGGDTQANCPTCGTAYVHNAAFHNQQPAVPNPVTTNAVTSDGTSITVPPPGGITQPKAPEPAQNAAGVWHYTCANGCAGGGGAAGPCQVCGGTLAHNAAYHN